MLDVLRNLDIGNMHHPVLANSSACIMSIGALSKPVAAAQSQPAHNLDPNVKAIMTLHEHSSTEVIDVNRISTDSQPVYQNVGIVDSMGHLQAADRNVNSSSWVKVITFANDIHDTNVMLAITGSGVVLKTTKLIYPGQALAIWFEENILAMMNMPYLKSANFKGAGYVCHLCNVEFEHPNPLKIHLALKCDRLDKSSLWAQLAKVFYAPQFTLHSPIFPKPFKFELTNSPRTSPIPIPSSDIKRESTPTTLNSSSGSNGSSTHNNSSFSSQSSNSPPVSSYTIAPKSPRRSPRPVSYCSSSSSTYSYASPPGKMLSQQQQQQQRHSAFKPYSMAKPKIFPQSSLLPSRGNLMIPPYHPYPSSQVAAAVINSNAHPAQVETIASSLHKSTEGHLCMFCGKVYSRKYGLKIHIRTHTGYKPLKCKYCLRPFGDPSNLNKHVRLHADGETPYRCDLCGKVLVRRRDLERHIRSRHHENAGHLSDASSDGLDM